MHEVGIKIMYLVLEVKPLTNLTILTSPPPPVSVHMLGNTYSLFTLGMGTIFSSTVKSRFIVARLNGKRNKNNVNSVTD